jgi:hypothetical protein
VIGHDISFLWRMFSCKSVLHVLEMAKNEWTKDCDPLGRGIGGRSARCDW